MSTPSAMRYLVLHAIQGTAIAHGLPGQVPVDVCHPSLTPRHTKPVFRLPGGEDLAEAVAVVYRDADGKPIDGGFFGYLPSGEVVRIALVDAEHGVNTDYDPAWVAFGLTMSLGKLLVQGPSDVYELPWSIVDFGLHQPNRAEHCPTPARVAVRKAFAPGWSAYASSPMAGA